MKDAAQTQKIRQSLDISWKEGIPAAAMLHVMDHYLIPYGLFLGATAQQIGFLASLPDLLASFFQLFAVRAVRTLGSRLRFIVRLAGMQAGLFIPLALLSLWIFPGRIACLILLAIAYKVLGNLIGTAWGSLVSDYLPAQKRGAYLGWRSQIAGLAGLGAVVFAGTLLYLAKKSHPALGFFLLFLGTAFLRFLSTSLLAKMADLAWHRTPESDFTFWMFVRRFRESNFVKFVLFVASVTFTTHLAAPYFSVYMLRDLQFNYLTYMTLQLAGIVSGLVAFPIWGTHADLVGNAKILKQLSFVIPVIPFLWLISPSPFYLACVQILAGAVWSGFNLCATNFVYDAVSPDKRVRCLGYFNLINGSALFGGALLGGFLADRLPPVFGFSLLALFAFSGLLRFFAHFLFSPKFREVRESARQVSSMKLFASVVGIRPLAGLSQEWGLWTFRDSSRAD